MGIEAFWQVLFQASDTGNAGAGVIVFETERVFGGDSSYYYTGHYNLEGDHVTAQVDVIHHAGAKNNIFGPVDRISFDFDLRLRGNELAGFGQMIGQRGRKVAVVFKRLANLP